MKDQLMQQIAQLAGPLREKTFVAAAEFILRECRLDPALIETGCCRGIPYDGQSTIILGMLAKEIDGQLVSIDINPSHIALAHALTIQHGIEDWVHFVNGDSIAEIGKVPPSHFFYLDSFDHDPADPCPCQRHQLAEVGALMGSIILPCAILLDDHVEETGGKTSLSSAFLEERGWKLAASGYQLLYTRQ